MRDFRLDQYNNSWPRRDFASQARSTNAQAVSAVFWELVHQVLEKIKNESFFKWPNKMGGDPMRCNQSLHCQYHQDREYTIKDYRTLWDHLDQLVRKGRLKQFCIIPMVRRARQVWNLGDMLLQDLLCAQ